MQIAKVFNAPGMWRDLYAIVLQRLGDQVAIGAKDNGGDDNARIIMESFLEGGGCQVRGWRIAFFSQWPRGLYIGSMANGASLQIECFSINVFCNGYRRLNQ